MQRRSVATALTIFLLYKANVLGYPIGILYSFDMVEGVCRKWGFQEYLKANCYLNMKD